MKNDRYKKRFVTTRGELRWNEKLKRFETVNREGYWYEGPWALAHTNANWESQDYRIYQDNSGEALGSETAYENENTDRTGHDLTEQVRLRFNWGEDAAADSNNSGTVKLQYNVDGAGWNDITTTTTDAAHAIGSNNTGLTDGDADSTERLSGMTGTVFNATWSELCEDGASNTSRTYSDDYTEFTFVVGFHTSAAGSTITFRVALDDGTVPSPAGAIASIGVVSGDVNAEPTGAEISGDAAAPSSVTGDANYTLTGAASAGEAGTAQSQVSINGEPVGAESAGEAQAPASVTGDSNYTLTGAESSADAGTVTVDVPRPALDFGRLGSTGLHHNYGDDFSHGGGGSSVNAEPVGAASAGEAQAPANVTGDVNYTLTGAESAAEAGTVDAVTPDVNVDITGAESAGEAQAPANVTGDVNYTLTGAESAGEAGAVTVDIGQSCFPDGASTAGQAGTVTVNAGVNVTLAGDESVGSGGAPTVDIVGSVVPELGPLGLTHKPYGTFRRDVTVTLTGAASSADQGPVQAQTPTVANQLAPTALPIKPRQFSPKIGDTIVNITGAEIDGQWAVPDSADTDIYVDGAESQAEAGTVEGDAQNDELVEAVGAEAAAEAGTVTAEGTAPVYPAGAEITGGAGEIQAFVEGTQATVSDTVLAGQAGDLTVEHDQIFPIVGAEINVQASDTGIDTNFDLSVTILPTTLDAEAGTVTVSFDPVPTTPSLDTHDLVGIRAGKKRKYRQAKRRAKRIVRKIIKEEVPATVKRVSRKRKYTAIERATEQIAREQLFVGDLYAIERAAATLVEAALAQRREQQRQQLQQELQALAPLVVPPRPPVVDSEAEIIGLMQDILKQDPAPQAQNAEEEELIVLMQILLN